MTICRLLSGPLAAARISHLAGRLTALLLLTLCCSLLNSCAGTAKGVDTSVYTKRSAPEAFTRSVPEASALVVIRYPAIIHADVETMYTSSFAVNSIG